MQKNENGGKVKAKEWPEDVSEIARQFLALFNGSMLYGSGHPNTAKNAAAFAELINACMDEEGGRGMVTVFSHNGAMIIEGSTVTDEALNAGKLLSHLERLAVTAISFERGVSAESVVRLMELAGDSNLDDLERFKAALADIARDAAAIPGVRINKAQYSEISVSAVINKELSDLTANAVVKLVREEYDSGKTPINRLARTIIRMLPDDAELVSLLPQMKETLLAEGMALADYLELVLALGLKVEAESEPLSDRLKEAADSAGATVSDIVAAIRSKPTEAGNLILRASEVRQATGAAGEGDSGLSEALAAYVEKVSSKIAVDMCADTGGSAALKGMLAQLEAEIYAQLLKCGVSKAAQTQVKKRLTAGFQEMLTEAGNALAAITLSRQESQAGEAEAEKASGAQEESSSGEAEAEKSDGEASDAQDSVESPLIEDEALNASSMLFMMNKEIKRNLRYKSPFATLIVSIEKASVDGAEPRALATEDTAELLPQLSNSLQALLRDVDMVGTINPDATASPELFVLLPMVGSEGTETVKNRIVKMVSESEFKRAAQKTTLEIKVSATVPGEGTKDLKSYLKVAKANHAI